MNYLNPKRFLIFLIGIAILSLTFATSQAQQPSTNQLPPPPPSTRNKQSTAVDEQTPAAIDKTAIQDDEVLTVETDLVNIPFTAVNGNRQFVTTLRKEDVRVLEDNRPQEVFVFQRQTELPLSLAILVDLSASQERTLPDQKRAALTFADSVVRVGSDTVAVVSFTGEAMLEQPSTKDLSKVRAAINRVQVIPPLPVSAEEDFEANEINYLARTTAIWDAIWATCEEVLSGPGALPSAATRRAIILLSDGADRDSRHTLQEAVERALRAETVIYAIGIGDESDDGYGGVNEGALRKIAERTGGKAFFPKQEADLQAAFNLIAQELRSQYLVAYSPANKARDGKLRKLRIEVVDPTLRKQKLRLTYRPSYFAKTASPTASR